jgi:hypothetical protein
MADPLRHRQTKGAATDMVDLTPPRHIPTLPRFGHPGCLFPDNGLFNKRRRGSGPPVFRSGHSTAFPTSAAGCDSKHRRLPTAKPGG